MPVRLDVGPLVVKFSKQCVVMGLRNVGSRHATFFFTPRVRRGRAVWTPHLTDVRWGKRFFFRVAHRRFLEWANQLQADLAAAFRDAHVRVELAQLEAAGWRAWRPDESVLMRMLKIVQVEPRRYRLDDDTITEVLEGLLPELDRHRVLPTELTAELCAKPVGLISPEGEGAWLLYYPTEAGLEVGWYVVPMEWGAQAVLERSFGGGVLAALERTKSFLGV